MEIYYAMFIFKVIYKKPLAEVEKFLQAHRDFLDVYYRKGKFVASGPQDPRNGGIILCNTNDADEALRIYQEDPFYINGIAEYELTHFHSTKHSVENFINAQE